MSAELANRLLRLKEVVLILGMKRSWILKKVKEGHFPKPIKLSERAIAWRESEILQWIEQRASVGPL